MSSSCLLLLPPRSLTSSLPNSALPLATTLPARASRSLPLPVDALVMRMYLEPFSALAASSSPASSSHARQLGRVYAVDAIGYDFYEHIGAYDGPVLMFQGSADNIEPRRYTDRAAEMYGDADYEVLSGAGHGFYGEDQRCVAQRAAEFVSTHAS